MQVLYHWQASDSKACM